MIFKTLVFMQLLKTTKKVYHVFTMVGQKNQVRKFWEFYKVRLFKSLNRLFVITKYLITLKKIGVHKLINIDVY